MNRIIKELKSLRWAAEYPDATPAELWESCDVGYWMLWVAKKLGVESDACTAVAYRAADRAIHIYAPDALDKAGLVGQADQLRSLPKIVDRKTAYSAFGVARSASGVASAVSDVARSVARATADAADAAWGAYASNSPAYTRDACYASGAAEGAADAADAVGDGVAERLQCADDCRELIGFGAIAEALERI